MENGVVLKAFQAFGLSVTQGAAGKFCSLNAVILQVKEVLGEFFDGILIHQCTEIEDIYSHLGGMQLLNILAF